ncbi:MAG TPA: 50S ribosomal protein L24 [Ignavibacteria bacterium]|jgi:large subunit ribosomal protein L24|nr:50S ribosomal protein L24 [Bacteroidota bacterium]HRF66572.1 50S ribosomal protein L24 [Ignavibacteria bacterium]HRJ03699.1 50S ribosomal protein L24 [Ignavibacteria bacterium]HRJ84806.1 50S ribosomal protein L24 [Ignavibacteria bacterium]
MTKLRKNDKVKIISGNNRGKEGKILKIYRSTNKVIVEGVNIIKRHTKPNQKNPQGGITQKEAPIQVSNVMLIDPKAGEPTRLGVQVIEEAEGKKKRMRYGKKSGEIIVS